MHTNTEGGTTNDKPKKTRVKKTQTKKVSQEARKQAEKRVELDKKIFHYQQLLIDSNVSESVLKEVATLFQPQQYLDVVTERAVDLCCGYPCCGNKLVSTKGLVPKYKLSVATKRVYDNSELLQYCGTECLIASKFYTSQLLSIPAHLRTADDLRSIEAIKFAKDITEEKLLEDTLSNKVHTSVVDEVNHLIMPYGEPTDLDKVQANISIHERQNTIPPSLDFSGALPKTTKPLTNSLPKIESIPLTQPLPQPLPHTTPSTATPNAHIPLEQRIDNLTLKDKPTNTKKPSTKKVQFQNGDTPQPKRYNVDTTASLSDEGSDKDDMSLYGMQDSSDRDDMSLYGMQDSSDDEPLNISMTPFGTLWTTLDNWKTPDTMRFLHATGLTNSADGGFPAFATTDDGNGGGDGGDDGGDDGSGDDGSGGNGDVGAQQQLFLPYRSQHSLRRQALFTSVSPHFASLRSILQLDYVIDQEVVTLIATFAMERALPAFSAHQWKTVALLFTELLAFQNNALAQQLRKGFFNNKKKILLSYNINVDEYNVLLDIFAKK